MALILRNLDEKTRSVMLDEINFDIDHDSLYISDRLNASGKEEYPRLLMENVKKGNDSSLADRLGRGFFNPTYRRKKPNGGYSEVKMPNNAPESLSEGEFNRFYIRALSKIVIDEGKGQLKVYRAKYSENPRPESEVKIGQIVDPHKLLDDLRNNIGINTSLGIPAGPNSGLSVELINIE